ncbi:YheC/YheD family protein [Robertmurraya korlensis]|uniref:YheC/YheD family protein n=1 Tax=Robertmurraya korlensis TaxID=519977 RepID=UPI0020404AC9|nr:YheC/YheD family protein [Robertmurraya korlensis]MCM3602256.1 YheC/YheD family protein [Robertmurraya korlensis]
MTSLNLRNINPFIGILTSKKGDRNLVGNIPLFRSIQQEILEIGGTSVVFSSDDILSNGIKAAKYDPSNHTWETVLAPFPHLVYNRVPFRKHEDTTAFKEAVTLFKEQSIPFYNPCFLNKYDCYLQFKDHLDLKPYFLPTIKIEDKTELEEFLLTHRSLYIKQANSSMGKGIHIINLKRDGKVLLVDQSHQAIYHDFHDYWGKWSNIFLKIFYIAQQAVSPQLYQGKRYDFRILAVFQGEKHVPVGVGIRQSGNQQVTTHIPNGGKLLPYSQFQTKEQDLLIKKIVELCGKDLNRKYGFFAEFSIDLGLTSEGRYVIYEINSKPMSFDEKTIEEKRVKMLCELFRSTIEKK